MRRSLLILLVSGAASTLFAGASVAQPSRAQAPSPSRVAAVVRAATAADHQARAALATSRLAARAARTGEREWTVPETHALKRAPNVTRSYRAGPAPLCDGRRATIVGTDGNDTLVGTPGRDVIAALGGN